MDLEIRHIRCFLAVTENSTLSAAARRLGVTQQAVSRQIGRIERAFGETLFIRGPNGVALTPAGLALLDRVKAAESAFHDVEVFLAAPRSRPVVRIGTEMAGLGRHLAGRNDGLMGAQVRITAEPAERTVAALAAGHLDLLQAYDFDAAPLVLPPGCRAMTVLVEPTSVAVLPRRHRLAKRSSVRLTDLAEDVWLTCPAGTRSHALVTVACRRAGFEPTIRYETSDSWTMDRYIHEFGCVTLGSPLAAPSDDNVYVPLDDPLPRRVMAMWAAAVADEQAKEFASVVRRWYLHLVRTRHPEYWQRHLAALS